MNMYQCQECGIEFEMPWGEDCLCGGLVKVLPERFKEDVETYERIRSRIKGVCDLLGYGYDEGIHLESGDLDDPEATFSVS